MIDLKPRAVAVLCALRSGPRSTASLRGAIGDPTIHQTESLLLCMESVDCGAAGSRRLVVRSTDGRWYLDHDGLGWLQTNGLDAVPAALILVAHPEREVRPL